MSETIITYLRKRGFIEQLTSEELVTASQKPLKVYTGFDPTADSLHLGNFMGIMALAHFQRFGHTPIILLGGTTGLIGDPSGKSQERPLLDRETVAANIRSIRTHFEKVLDFSGKYSRPIFVNNDDWFSQFYVVDFLRDVGKHFRIGTMLAKDSVRTRIDSEEGMSFTEFSYQLIQAYDFYHLYTDKGVSLQMGGSDQWGNITAGTDLIRKKGRGAAFGLTWPLLTRSDGKKFGKSEEGAIWLSVEKCSPYQFYQYLVRMPDADVIAMLKLLTFLDLEEIESIERQMKSSSYLPNTAQKRLAEEVTRILHGEAGVEAALKATLGAAPGKEAKLSGEVLSEIASDMPSLSLSKEDVVGKKYRDLAAACGAVSSKGEATRLVMNGGAYINNVKIADPSHQVQESDLIDGKFLLIGAGKKKKVLIKIK